MGEQKKAPIKERFGWLGKYLTVKVLAGAAGVIVLLLVGIGIGTAFSTESDTTEIGFEDIGELATQVAYCTEVNVTEAERELWGISIPFTQSKYIYSYDVEIKAGLNFSEIEWSLDEENRAIEVKLPEIRVLSNEIDIDSFRLYHEDESIFRQITLEENNAALASLKETAEADAVANGLLENARDNAETVLRGFFASVYDPEEYEMRFTDK